MHARVDFFASEFRNTRQSYGDLLRHESVIENGIILGKGGELIVSFRFRGQDLQCASRPELEQISLRVNTAVKKLGTGWMWHTTSSRRSCEEYIDEGAFPDPVTRAIEAERRTQYQQEGTHFQNDYVLTVTYLPPVLLASKIRSLVFEKEEGQVLDDAALGRKELQYFKKRVDELVSELSRDLGGMEALRSEWIYDPATMKMIHVDHQLGFLLWCAVGIHQQVRLPLRVAPVGLDAIIGSQPFYGGIRPQVGKKLIRIISIETPPESGTEVGMLDILNSVPVEYRWTTRWIARDAEHAKSILADTRRKWRQKIRGFVSQATGRNTGQVNEDAVKMAADTEAAHTDIDSGQVSYGHYTSTIVLMHEDPTELEAAVSYLLKTLRFSHFVVRDEDVNTVDAFMGSIPGHGYENVRRPLMHSLNLAHLLPLSSVWQGPVKHPCSFYQKAYKAGEIVPPLFYGAASGGTPFRVILHNDDVGHSLVVGPTGAGKSVILGLMAMQHFRYPNAKLFAFEKGESMFVGCDAAGGDHYAFLSDDDESAKKFGLCPFARVHRIGERIWAADYVETLLQLNGITVDHNLSKEILNALELLGTRPVHMRSFTELAIIVQSEHAREVLKLYETQLAAGMLNARADSISLNRFTVFEMEYLMSMGDKHVVPVLLYLFRAIERALDGSPVMIILDEAWLMLDHPLFQAKIKEWLKVLRKANALVIFATQELEDLAGSKIKSTIYQACKTRILLPNPAATSDDGYKLYKELGLTYREAELLQYGVNKRDYFFSSPSGRRMFQLELGPVALSFVATSGKDDRVNARKLKQLHGDGWVSHWLSERGISPRVLVGT
ncbi:TraG/VirB4 family ATPase [Glaciimonas sp. GG7]